MRNFLWDGEAVKRHIKGVILKYLDTDFFSERKVFGSLWDWGFLWLSVSFLPSFPTVYMRNSQAELQERLGFTFTIFQWVCACFRVFVHSLLYLIKRGVIPELPRKDLSAFCEIFVWNSQVFMLLIEKFKILSFYLGKLDLNRIKKWRLRIVYFNAVHKVHIIQAIYFLKRSKAVLIFLDPSPERKPSVMKSLWEGYFVVSNFLLSFWIPFQERLNLFCSSGLLCYSPFHLWAKNLVQTQNSIAWPDFSAQSCLKQKHQDYSSLYHGMVYSKNWVLFSGMQFFSQSEGSLEWKCSISYILLMVCSIM